MEKNFYEILEVDKDASPEVIEKAYKTLIKKFHPDLQQGNLKEQYEEKIKKINEAYEILSDQEKRDKYNLTLINNKINADEYNKLYSENINLKNEINYLKNKANNNTNNNNVNTVNNNSNTNDNYSKNNYQINKDIDEKINNAVNRAYYDAYIQDLKNRGYKIKYKKTFKDFLSLILTILVIIILAFILWHIPPVKNYIINTYYSNEFIKIFVDSLIKNK